MPNYVLLYYAGEKIQMSPEEGAEHMKKFGAWVGSLGDAVVNPGTPFGPAKTVSSGGVTDVDPSRPLTGFTTIKAESLDAAIGMVKDCPFLVMGTVDVAEAKEM